MKLHILSVSISVFFACLLFHVILWRTRRPKNDMGALFLVFWVLPAAAFALYLALSCTLLPGIALPLDEALAVFLMYMSLGAAYIQNYPPAQVPAPTLKIILLFESAGARGLTLEELSRQVNNKELVTTALDDLESAGLVDNRGGILHMTAASSRLLHTMLAFRKLLGLTFKGG